jgi:hypothetical protein
MALTLRQRALIHIVVQRFDRETQTTRLDATALGSELSAETTALAGDVDILVAEGYVEWADDTGSGGAEGRGLSADGQTQVWVLNPTDRAVMAAMGLE